MSVRAVVSQYYPKEFCNKIRLYGVLDKCIFQNNNFKVFNEYTKGLTNENINLEEYKQKYEEHAQSLITSIADKLPGYIDEAYQKYIATPAGAEEVKREEERRKAEEAKNKEEERRKAEEAKKKEEIDKATTPVLSEYAEKSSEIKGQYEIAKSAVEALFQNVKEAKERAAEAAENAKKAFSAVQIAINDFKTNSEGNTAEAKKAIETKIEEVRKAITAAEEEVITVGRIRNDFEEENNKLLNLKARAEKLCEKVEKYYDGLPESLQSKYDLRLGKIVGLNDKGQLYYELTPDYIKEADACVRRIKERVAVASKLNKSLDDLIEGAKAEAETGTQARKRAAKVDKGIDVEQEDGKIVRKVLRGVKVSKDIKARAERGTLSAFYRISVARKKGEENNSIKLKHYYMTPTEYTGLRKLFNGISSDSINCSGWVFDIKYLTKKLKNDKGLPNESKKIAAYINGLQGKEKELKGKIVSSYMEKEIDKKEIARMDELRKAISKYMSKLEFEQYPQQGTPAEWDGKEKGNFYPILEQYFKGVKKPRGMNGYFTSNSFLSRLLTHCKFRETEK